MLSKQTKPSHQYFDIIKGTHFFLQSLSQLTSSQWRLLLLHPQRKDLCRDWIAFKTHLGPTKTEKRYKGMDCRVNLSRTARLGRLREQKVQEFRRFSSLSRSFFKEACLMSASKRGITGGKEPWENGIKTYVRNNYKGKEWHGIANRGKITTDFPIKRYLAGN